MKPLTLPADQGRSRGFERGHGLRNWPVWMLEYTWNVKGIRRNLPIALLFLSSNLLFIEPAQATLYAFTSHTFTNCSATGPTGPTKTACRTAYSTTWDESDSYFNTSSGIQLWTVPVNGTYRITAIGAHGSNTEGSTLGYGTSIRGDFTLTQSSILKVLVGHYASNSGGGGGGGGSFVVDSATSTIYTIAGGGGGSGSGGGWSLTDPSLTKDASTTTSGRPGTRYLGTETGGAGGTNGSAGGATVSSWNGFPGAGYSGDASVGGANSFLNGGAGGTANVYSTGAFGGGGAGGQYGAGGGGGYSGGGANARHAPGGGGGSFNSGTNQINIISSELTNGSVTIELLATPDTTPPTFTSSSSFSAAENIATSATAATIRISESATVTISSGADAARFNITKSDTDTAIIKFNVSPDFEAPADVGGNNVYDITLTATDAAANAGTQSITITVTDVVDTSGFNSLALAGSATTASYRTVVVITANITVASKVTFRVNGKILPGCKNKSTTGSSPNIVATCSWKPSNRGVVSLTASAAPTGAGISNSTSTPLSIMVANRTGSRVA